jgi:hypothetical protein
LCSAREQHSQQQQLGSTVKRKLSNTSLFDDVESNSEFNAALNEYVASPVTTRARAQSFSSMYHSDLPSAVISGLNNSVISQSSTPATRRQSCGSSKKSTPKSKRNGARNPVRKPFSTNFPSPTDTDATPTLKHLHRFTQTTGIDLDMHNFIEEMRQEKHNNMLLEDEFSVSGDSDVEEKPEAKKPNGGARRPTSTSRTPANWVPPVPGLVEIPATRLRNRQLKEKERLAKAAKEGSHCMESVASDNVPRFDMSLIIDRQTRSENRTSIARRKHPRYHDSGQLICATS